MRAISFGLSDMGTKRNNNEDAWAIREDLNLYVVADGMGGHSSGELASAMAVEQIVEFLKQAKLDEESTWPWAYDDSFSLAANKLKIAISTANEKIHGYALEHSESRGMGTTVVAALLTDSTLSIGYVGDSRAYLLRKGELSLITSDHSWVNEQVRLGHLSGEEAAHHPFRNVITKALGTKDDAQPDLLETEILPGDTLLLCTDGLNSMVPDREIASAFVEGAAPQDICRTLVDLANQRGGEDNITVAVIRWEP